MATTGATAGATAGAIAAPGAELLLSVMTGGWSKQRRGLSVLEACHSAGIQCLAYDDQEVQGARLAIDHVAPSRYVSNIQPPLPSPPGVLACCDRYWPGRPPRANGSSHFFCRPHVRETLQSQYRFLPALIHATNVLLASRTLRWLAMVDDDSAVDGIKLLSFLRSSSVSRCEGGRGLYLGDFGEATHSTRRSAARGAAFACGGGGHIFDRAALLKIDWLRCARELHTSCAQSDWMIGACAARFGVTPMADGRLSYTSCGLCSMGCSRSTKLRILQTINASRGSNAWSCAFAQLTPTTLCPDRSDPKFSRVVCEWGGHGASIRHGWPQPGCQSFV